MMQLSAAVEITNGIRGAGAGYASISGASPDADNSCRFLGCIADDIFKGLTADGAEQSVLSQRNGTFDDQDIAAMQPRESSSISIRGLANLRRHTAFRPH